MPLQKPQRTFDNLLMLFTMASVPWEEARRLAREFADKASVPEHECPEHECPEQEVAA